MAGVPMLIPKWIIDKLNNVKAGFVGTTAEVQAAMQAGEIENGELVYVTDDEGSGVVTASNVTYNNTGTTIQSTNVQGAITELNDNLTAEDDLVFKFSKSGSDYGYKDSSNNFVPFGNGFGINKIGSLSSGSSAITYSANAKGLKIVPYSVVSLIPMPSTDVFLDDLTVTTIGIYGISISTDPTGSVNINKTTRQLTWATGTGVDHYVVYEYVF